MNKNNIVRQLENDLNFYRDKEEENKAIFLDSEDKNNKLTDIVH